MRAAEGSAAMGDGLSDRAFTQLARYIYDYCGIKISPAKKGMLEGRLRRRVRVLGLGGLEQYHRFLFDEGGLDQETTALIDAVTTNKTDFFREPHHFQFLQDVIVPGFLAHDRDEGRPLRLWSAGCSTGAEPYTIAMVCEWAGKRLGRFRYHLLATDICTKVLEDALRAVYPHDMVECVPLEMRRQFLLKSRQPGRGLVRMCPALRGAVRFQHLNLMDASYPVDEPLDVIFCRNLLIYFDRPTQQAVLTRLCRHLRPGGYLILGHSESINGYNLPVQQVGTTIFQKEGGAWARSVF